MLLLISISFNVMLALASVTQPASLCSFACIMLLLLRALAACSARSIAKASALLLRALALAMLLLHAACARSKQQRKQPAMLRAQHAAAVRAQSSSRAL